MKLSFEQNSQVIWLELIPSGKSYRATLGAETVTVEVLQAKEGRLDLLVDGQHVTAYVSAENSRRWVTIDGQTAVLMKSAGAHSRAHGHPHAAGELSAPMPGQIRTLNVRAGESVTKGQTLIVLEAMKMEIRVQAPQDGRVKKVFVQPGQTVEREQTLIEIE